MFQTDDSGSLFIKENEKVKLPMQCFYHFYIYIKNA